MKFCFKCGNQLNDDFDFCPKCGTKVNYSSNNVNNKQENISETGEYNCPNCGGILNEYVAHCPYCGCEIHNRKVIRSVQELKEALAEIEANRKERKYGRHNRLRETTETDKKIITIIKSFPIPNTKADILDFVFLSASNIDIKTYENTFDDVRREISDAWLAKLDQAYYKAEVMLVNDDEFNKIKKIYENIRKRINRESKKEIKVIGFLYLILFGLFAVILVPGIITSINRTPEERREMHLTQLVEDIEDDIAAGKFTNARNKAFNLTFDESLSAERSEYWKKRQQEIFDIIEEASGGNYENILETNEINDDKLGGFVNGIEKGISNGNEALQSGIDDFNSLINGD